MATVTVDAWSTVGHLVGGDRGERRTLSMYVDDGETLAELLEKLADEYTEFERVMYKPGTREPSEYLAIVVNDRLPELLDGYQTRLDDGDKILIVQAYQGG
jgi:molybdopterin converting factor small subunit